MIGRFRLLVTGTRDNSDAIRGFVWRHLSQFALLTVPPSQALVVIHGQCPKGGVDLYAEDWARANGHEWERHPADWAKFGKSAGYLRNKSMVDTRPDYCLGFPGPGSRGTWDCIQQAVSRGITTQVHIIQNLGS